VKPQDSKSVSLSYRQRWIC